MRSKLSHMRTALGVLMLTTIACGSNPAVTDAGAGGGSAGAGGASAGGGAAGGAGGGTGGGASLCADSAASCQRNGALCGQATLGCGRIDCGTCSIGSLASTGLTPERLAVAGLPGGVAVALGGTLSLTLLLPQDAGGAGFDGGYARQVVPGGATATTGQSLSMAAAADGTVWVGYVTGNPSRVYVASSSGAFAPETVGSGSMVSVAVDGPGRPRVAFYGTEGGQTGLFEAHRDAGVWVKQLTDAARRGDISLSLAIDSAGRSHLLYVTDLRGAVSHAVRAPSGVTIEPVWPGSSFNDFQRVALAAGANDELHAVWTSADGELVYGRRVAAGWVTSTVPRRVVRDSDVSVSLRAGHAQLAFADDDFAYYAAPLDDAGFALQRLNRARAGRIGIAVDGRGTVFVPSVDDGPGAAGLSIWTFTGKYPDGYAERVQQIATGLCSKARECLGDAGTFCVQYSYGDSCAAPFSSCIGAMTANLWSVTVDAGLVDACLAGLAAATCGPVGSPPRPGAVAPAACAGLPY